MSVAEQNRASGEELSGPDCSVVVIGCGNLLRGDDGAGPVLVRRLWETGPPAGARLVDGGTAGMDVAFQMRGAERVVLIDASRSGAAPGTVFRVPGPELEELPPLGGMQSHSFRWDHALAFAHWLLGDEYPADITVFLIEAQCTDFGTEITPPVSDGMDRVVAEIERGWFAPLRPAGAGGAARHPQVEFTADGYVRLGAALAAERFPSDSAVALHRDGELWLVPLRGPASGGLLLKQRNLDGDRCVLVREVLADRLPVGTRPAVWDDDKGALRVTLTSESSPP